MTYDRTHSAPESWAQFRVAQAIVRRGEDILLCANRWYSDRPPVWTLPGGRAEPGELLADALVREVREETGLEVEVGRLAYVVEARSPSAKRLFLTCVFRAEVVGGEFGESHDIGVEDVRFVPVAQLGELMPARSLAEPLLAYLAESEAIMRYWSYGDYDAAGN
jgi:ADP-ribose pyrophosphatase YjhB (NUDIX family)